MFHRHRSFASWWKAIGPIMIAMVLVAPRTSAAQQQPEVALLVSANTQTYFGRHYPACSLDDSNPRSYYLGADEYQRYVQGWQRVLDEMTVPYTIISDTQVTSGHLQNFKVLILSNAASLSRDETRAIVSWVRGGGRLLATFGSGYKSTGIDVRTADLLKLQEGGVNGLHELWHDPLTSSFGTDHLAPGVDVLIDRYEGPTQCLEGILVDDRLPYGAQGNLLVQRPYAHDSVLASLAIDNPDWKRRAPAILVSKATRGLVVYFAFAPEYLVSKEFGLPAPESCPDGQDWSGRSKQARLLMECTTRFLLSE